MTKQIQISAATFWNTVHNLDVEQVRRYVHQDPDWVNAQDEYTNTPLHYAAQCLNVEMAKILLSYGADPNASGHFGTKPLHDACDIRPVEDAGTQREMLQLLVDHGACVNAKNRKHITPLHKAVRARSVTAVRFLLENGAEVNAKDTGRGSTPLRQAVTNTGAGGTAGRNSEALVITEMLLAYGADPFMTDKRGKMVIESARSPAIIELLQKGVDVDLSASVDKT